MIKTHRTFGRGLTTKDHTLGHYRRRRRREFLELMNDLVAKYPGKELHVVLDNLYAIRH
jgi:hypothetical protein